MGKKARVSLDKDEWTRILKSQGTTIEDRRGGVVDAAKSPEWDVKTERKIIRIYK